MMVMIDDSTIGGIRIEMLRESNSTDACVFEVMSRLDIVDPAIRPKLKTGVSFIINFPSYSECLVQAWMLRNSTHNNSRYGTRL
jgi:hypothetical protein